MDERIKMIETKIKILKKNKPNIGNMWEIYLKVKKESYLKSLNDFEEMLKRHERSVDLKKETILTLFILNNANMI